MKGLSSSPLVLSWWWSAMLLMRLSSSCNTSPHLPRVSISLTPFPHYHPSDWHGNGSPTFSEIPIRMCTALCLGYYLGTTVITADMRINSTIATCRGFHLVVLTAPAFISTFFMLILSFFEVALFLTLHNAAHILRLCPRHPGPTVPV